MSNGRKYDKEYEWAKGKYDQIRFSIPRETGDEFREKLKREGIGIAEWGRKKIEQFLKESD